MRQNREILRAGKWLKKRQVLSLFSLNVDSVTDDVTSDGTPFQVFAAATQNARSPTVWRRVCGMARSADDAECQRCRPVKPKSSIILMDRTLWPFRLEHFICRYIAYKLGGRGSVHTELPWVGVICPSILCVILVTSFCASHLQHWLSLLTDSRPVFENRPTYFTFFFRFQKTWLLTGVVVLGFWSWPRGASRPVADPKILKGGRKTIYQPRPHLLQMHTTIYMPFTWKKAAFWKKNWANRRGRPLPPPLWIRHWSWS